ncbi:helix-turn-helix transcriptional regulator [Streptomyces sp. SudanB25_2051]|uniref:helix-turn-helix transcriptional regulator n=1 Tax=Streptomyces sp. SudanB25_2051 TaxID=3035275 RepID=UPI003F54FCFB
MDYDFTFVVSGVDVDDQAAVASLEERCDALLARAGGVDLLSITGSGASAFEAALNAVSSARAAVPQLRVCRLDRDLVGVHEIAERTGRTRQNVSQWIAGARKGQGDPFPAAEGTVGRSQAWLWSEVNQWLAAHGLDDGAAYPTRAEMAEIDVALANAVTLHFTVADTPGFDAGRDRVVQELESKHLSRFMKYLAGLDLTTGERGAHVLLVADAGEPAHGVMECVSSFAHDVILVTATDQFTATVLSTRAPLRPTPVITVPQESTVGDWLRLVQENPQAAFAPEGSEAVEKEVPTIRRRLAIAA